MRFLSLLFLVCLFTLSAAFQTSKTVPKPRSKAASPSASPTPVKKKTRNIPAKPDEKTAWDKIAGLTEPAAKISALKEFVESYPASPNRDASLAMLAAARAELGNAKLASGDVETAATLLKDAASEAPRPVSEQLWNDALSKVPFNLYFRGARQAAYDAARSLEDKTEGNSAQSLGLANFYLTVEDGASARRIAERVIAAEPNSASAYQTLGLAYRVDFQLEESANAYAKAVELDADSLPAKRGLAEAKRSLGKADEAAALYREILAKDAANIPAETGLVLSLFDSGKRADAEAELAKALGSNEGNVILLASTAYWYAAHGDGEKAVDLAQKAIASDPRFIWSHIALARGYQIQNRFAEAEKALFNAQRYGNFPTMEYELASARYGAGYYRDAADELSKSFSVKDGSISLKLGGRVPRESKDIVDLVGFERRASIFAPTAADDPATAQKLVALLEFRQALDSEDATAEVLAGAAERFAAGDDRMSVFRKIYAAKELLAKNLALDEAVELVKTASPLIDKGIESQSAASAVMGGEIYSVRADSARRGEYVNVPEIPKAVMSSILRGEVEAVLGWAAFQAKNSDEAVIHLKRAVTVFPADSAWWRTNMWRLGSALAAAGKDAEALDTYIKAYKSGTGPDAIHYAVVEAAYKRVNGNTEGLVDKIGPDPAQPIKPAETNVTTPTAAEPSQSAAAPPAGNDTKPVEEKPATAVPAPASDKACSINVSEEQVSLAAAGAPLSIMVSSDADVSLDDLNGVSSSPADVSVTREMIAGVTSRAVFVLKSTSGKPGIFGITFQMPCGKKEVTVTVK